MVANELFDKWSPMEDTGHPKMTIAKVVIREEILNNVKQQNIGKNVVLEDKNGTLDENLPIALLTLELVPSWMQGFTGHNPTRISQNCHLSRSSSAL